MTVKPPQTVDELMQRVQSLAGKTLGSCIGDLLPNARHKGSIGHLAEKLLGATAGSQAAPDFVDLSIELKTLPIKAGSRVIESTYVCVLNLAQQQQFFWQHSLLKKKLTRVLWLPIESDPALPFAQRRFGQGFLWQPTESQWRLLREDWHEIVDTIRLEGLEQVSSSMGSVLQLRPKGADGRSLTSSRHKHLPPTLPRGFYLRAAFTTELYHNNLNCLHKNHF